MCVDLRGVVIGAVLCTRSLGTLIRRFQSWSRGASFFALMVRLWTDRRKQSCFSVSDRDVAAGGRRRL